jgi:glycosyltransferase involved in cell wall biosynthesis
MKLTIVVTNSLRKDPRVQKSVKMAVDNGISTCFVGVMDSNYRPEYFKGVGFEVRLVKYPKYFYSLGYGLLVKIFREIHRNILIAREIYRSSPDVIHANDFDTLPASWVVAKLTGARVIYDSHEIFTENGSIAKKPIIKKFVKYVEGFLARRVCHMVSVSHSASKLLSDFYGIRKPTVITNCPYRERVENCHKSGKFEVLYQGQYYKGRGYENFILSAKYVSEDIVLVLRGYGDLEGELRRLVIENNLEQKVRFDSPVEIRELISAASKSNLGVVLTEPISDNFKYTVSNKLFEYIGAGLPVLLSDLPEHRLLVEKYGFGEVLDNIEPKTIADALVRLSKGGDVFNQMLEKASQAADVLCWENEGRKFIEIYDRCFGRVN